MTNELKYDKKEIFSSISKQEQKQMYEYCNNYMSFLNQCKTEYKCVEYTEKILKINGFKNLEDVKAVKTGDKVYFINKERAIFAALIGENDIIDGVNIVGAHIDSPRLDTKPLPLIEGQNLAMLKTQYYGGIKNYQWLTIPLALYGVIYTESGEKLDIVIGEKEDDPIFTISDLLPHLGREELEKKARDFVDPENLNVIVGSTKLKGVEKDAVKMQVLKILNDKYGIKEIDFARSDIRFVPAYNARYVGLDKGIIASYGQDDRVCSYAALSALLSLGEKVSKTAIMLLVDKEEIGSTGNSSMSSETFEMFLKEIMYKSNVKIDLSLALNKCLYNSKMLSADVSAAVDPMHVEVSDVQNANILGHGVSIEKYTGSGGKYSASEATAKYMNFVMALFDKNNITYQIGTLGKIGKGGGGTIAYILADKGVDVVDCGTPVLSMHSPYELASVGDVYMTAKAYTVFFKG